MAKAINKITGEKVFSIGYKQEPYFSDSNWIINFTEEEDILYSPKQSLDDIKGLRKLSISNHTGYLIEQHGFTCHSLKWGCTQVDQNNWNTLVNTIISAKMLGATDEQIFPIENEVKDWEGNLVTMPSLLYINDIIMAGKQHVNSYRLSQTELFNSIDACSTLEEINLIVDTRT